MRDIGQCQDGLAGSAGQGSDARVARGGMLLAILAFFLWACTSACLKLARETMPALQVTFVRSVVGVVLISAIAGRSILKPGALAPAGTFKLHLLRSALMVWAMLSSSYALHFLLLSDATAIGYTNPLFLAILARLVLGELVSPLRWLAILSGFVGVLIVLQPQAGMVSVPALVLLSGSVASASCDIVGRKLSAGQSSVTIVLMACGLSTCLLLPAIPYAWRSPTPGEWGRLVAVGVLGSLFQLALIRALQLLPAALVAPFSYTSLVWTITFGWLLWGEVPTANGMVGALFIIADGLLTFLSARAQRSAGAPSDGTRTLEQMKDR